jgi:hypothetical protein
MFWDSVTSGLSVLLHWQTYAAAGLFLALSMGPMALIGIVAMKSERAGGLVGCLSMLVMPFFQVFALVVFVLTMSPILLGLSDQAAWSLPWVLTVREPWLVSKFVGMLLIAALVLAFIPILGSVTSLHTLLLGSFALALVVGLLGPSNPQLAAKDVAFWPGAWFVVGLVVVGSALGWIGMLCAGLVSVAVDGLAEGLGQLVAFRLAAIFGFIPLFIYAAWLGAQLHAG